MKVGIDRAKKIPPDFPRENCVAALAGVQPKVGARLIDGKFVAGLTEDELYERYDACEDLALQLVGYCDRKLQAHPQWDLPTLLAKVRAGLGGKNWDLSSAEFNWIMTQVSVRMPARPHGK